MQKRKDVRRKEKNVFAAQMAVLRWKNVPKSQRSAHARMMVQRREALKKVAK